MSSKELLRIQAEAQKAALEPAHQLQNSLWEHANHIHCFKGHLTVQKQQNPARIGIIHEHTNVTNEKKNCFVP